MQYNYSLRKSLTGVSYISFLNIFDKKEFLNDFLKALNEIILNWEEIKDSVEMIDSYNEYLIEDYKKNGMEVSEEDFEGSNDPIDNYINTSIGKINLVVTGLKIEITSRDEGVIKRVSDILENNYLFNKTIE